MGRENYPAGHLLLWSSGQTVNLIPKVFPDKPSSYIEMEQVRSSKTWTAPEDGWFQFIGLATSGKGGVDAYGQYGTQHFGGGGGGAGGITVSVYALSKGDTISLFVGTGTQIKNNKSEEIAMTTQGGDGSDGSAYSTGEYYLGGGGSGGDAQGGNIQNLSGYPGEDGERTRSGEGRTNSYGGYSTKGGHEGSAGTAAYIVVLRGNTNLTQAQLNSYDISTLMLNNTQLEQEVTGILLSQSAQ